MKLKDWDDGGQNRREQGRRRPDGKAGSDGKQEQDMEFQWDEPETDFWLEDSDEDVNRDSGRDAEAEDFESMDSGENGSTEDDWEDLPPLKPWTKVLIFLGLAALSAIICAVLWHFTHPDKPVAGEDGSQVSGTEPGIEAGQEPAATQAPVLEPTQAPTPEPTQAPTLEPVQTPAPTPEATEAPAQSPTPPAEPEKEPVAGDEGMEFTAVQESVTPKDIVNLRSVPTTADAENIVAQASNGETLARSGINQNTGWSRIDYNGQVVYAVSQYLTTDLDYRTPVQPADPNRVGTISGRIILFKDCDDWISPKEYVNLRTEPSTTEGNSTVSCQLNYGERAHRTGYSTDSGWSRVEYNGQVLYVVTSLIYEVPAQ